MPSSKQNINADQRSAFESGCALYKWWFRQPAILLIFQTIKQAEKKEKALKYGLKRLQNLLLTKRQEISRSNRKLHRLQQALCAKEDEIKRLHNELTENNYALSALAKHLDNEKKDYESEISRLVVTSILPIVKSLKQEKTLSRFSLELNLLESYIANLSPKGLKNQAVLNHLTEAEGQIATLIRKGMTSKKIAALLYISSETVRTHRKNIRKKLKIQNTDINLRAYLNQNSTDGLY